MAHRLGYLSPSARVSTRPDAATSGPRAHILGTIQGFESLGWEVERFITGDRLPGVASGSAAERRITGSLPRRALVDLARLAVGVRYGRMAYRQLRGKVDWVYERFATLQTYGRRFQRDGTPWILEVNGPFFYEARHERKSLALTGLAERIEVAAYRDCDVLVAVTDALREIILDQTGIDEDRILVVPNGVDTDFFDPSAVDPVYPLDGFTVGFVGGLAPWQALDRLVRAVATLRAEGTTINVVVVGDGRMRSAWEALVDELDLRAAIRFVGRVDRAEVRRYIAGFDAGYSGQTRMSIGSMYHSPLKLYEYMAMGRPVIAADHEDAATLIEHGVTGFLFDSGSSGSLEEALREAVRARERLPEMGRAARAVVVASHSWERRVADLIEGVRQRVPSAL